MGILKNKLLFCLIVALSLTVIFHLAQIVKAQQDLGSYYIPPGASPEGEFYEVLDTGNLSQTKEGVLYFGTYPVTSDKEREIRSILPFGGVVLGLGGRLCSQQGEGGWNCSLTFGGGHWIKNAATGSIYYNEGSVGIGTGDRPEGIFGVVGAGEVFFRAGTVNIGFSNRITPLNVYSNFHIERVPNVSPTGYVYKRNAFGISKYSTDYDFNDFGEWVRAFRDKFEGKTWEEVKITNTRTDGDCEDLSMTDEDCPLETYKASVNAPNYVYDLDVFRSGNLYALAYHEFKKEQTGFSGGTLFSENAYFTYRTGVGITNPRTGLDISGGELRVGSSGVDCSVSNMGAIRFVNNDFKGCNGSEWVSFTAVPEPPTLPPVYSYWLQLRDLGNPYCDWDYECPPPRQYAVGFSIGNKGYIGTGDMGTADYLDDFWEYTPEADAWTQLGRIPRALYGDPPPRELTGGRNGAVGFSIGNRGYVGLGEYTRGYYLNDFWEYNPSSNIWTRKADFPGGRRVYAVGFSVNGKGYVGWGIDKKSGLLENERASFWGYDPSKDEWNQVTDPGSKNARSRAVSFVIGNKAYAGAGATRNLLGFSNRASFFEFDSSSKTWRQIQSLPSSQRSAVAFSIDGSGYVGTGIPRKSDFWKYDPVRGIWTKAPELTAPLRENAIGFSIGNRGYIGTGSGAENYLLKDFWMFCPLGC